MAHPLKHAESSARKFGGKASDYIALHTWFDDSKAHMSDFRHRALKHHSQGIFLAEEVFGVALTTSDGKQVPVRLVGEQHVREDLGRIPTVADWLSEIVPQRWMYGQRAGSSIKSRGNHPEGSEELHRTERSRRRCGAGTSCGFDAICFGIDWGLLQEQKKTLYRLQESATCTAEDVMNLEGLINLVELLQDHSERRGLWNVHDRQIVAPSAAVGNGHK